MTIEATPEIFKLISEFANFGIVLTAMDGTVKYINKYFAHAHGYEPGELIGQNLLIFYPPDQHKEIRQLFDRMSESESLNTVESIHIHKNGHKFPMRMNVIMIDDESIHSPIVAATAIAGLTTVAVGPILAVIVVGISVSILLEYADNSVGITNRVIAGLEELGDSAESYLLA